MPENEEVIIQEDGVNMGGSKGGMRPPLTTTTPSN